MPPPEAKEQTRGPQGGPGANTVCGLVRFPVTRSSINVTVAAVALPVAFPGMKRPPPSAIAVPPPTVPVVKPPVIVTRLIETVGAVAPEKSPIVTTGPPPLMIVAAAETPTRLRLFAIMIPPANVPEPIWIVSPSWAAFTAAWTVEKHPGFAVSTHSVPNGPACAAPAQPSAASATVTEMKRLVFIGDSFV